MQYKFLSCSVQHHSEVSNFLNEEVSKLLKEGYKLESVDQSTPQYTYEKNSKIFQSYSHCVFVRMSKE